MRLSRDFPRGAYVVANELLHLIDDTPPRGPYLFFVSSWGKYFENGKTDDLGNLRTFFIRMHRAADAAIPVTLDVQKAITCEIEPNTQGGPTRVVLHFDLVLPPFVPEETDDEAIDDYFGNLESYCRELLDGLTKSPAEDAPKKRGPTEKTRLRAEIFREIKEVHRNWGLDKVADEAMLRYPDIGGGITAETVRHAYDAMGWEWERADRIR